MTEGGQGGFSKGKSECDPGLKIPLACQGSGGDKRLFPELGMSKQALESTAIPEGETGRTSPGAQGNELTFGTTERAHAELLVINYTILNFF